MKKREFEKVVEVPFKNNKHVYSIGFVDSDIEYVNTNFGLDQLKDELKKIIDLQDYEVLCI
ncbi:hypothetical protein [Shewanella chilikensis]|uniref:hypothetical protein n=1 Tax=Shewanella chilikensis TaxID=558541 RepID=UPI0030066990